MCALKTASDGRIIIALSLSAGRCTTTENAEQRSSVFVVHGDKESGDVGGLAMPVNGTWSKFEEENTKASGGMLVVRTPFITAEGGEAGTLPYGAYTEALAARVMAALTHPYGADLLTVTHGAAGSGKSIQLFGAALAGGCDLGRTNETCSVTGHCCGLLSAVLQRVFAAGELESSVAVSVVEWRPLSDRSHNSSFCSRKTVNISEANADGEDGSIDDNGVVLMEAIDLLARTNDSGSPTGCFMEDYADIPATRYVRCDSVADTLAVLHAALCYSSSWQTVGLALAQVSADELGLPDTRLEAERRRRAAEVGDEERWCQDAAHKGKIYLASKHDDFLRPTAGATSHVLVTLLFRFAGGTTSIWRLWDLSGPSAWVDDGSSALRITLATHAALSQMAHRYMYRDRLQDWWWLAASPPSHIDEVIPLFSKQGRDGRTVVNKVAAMIEASLQHTCSSVLWIASLRRDACYDDINSDVLETAASLLTGADHKNGNVIAELRRRRRQENLDAAARVMEMFAEPFSEFVFRQRRVPQNCSANASHNASTGFNAVETVTRATPKKSSVLQRPCIMSPEIGVLDSEVMTLSEINVSSPVSSARDTALESFLAARHVSGFSPTFASFHQHSVADVASSLSMSKKSETQSGLRACYTHDNRELQGTQLEKTNIKEHDDDGAARYSPPRSLLHVSPLRSALYPPGSNLGAKSPLSPPSVAGTGHPEETAIPATNLWRKDVSWSLATDEAGTPSRVSSLKDGGYEDNSSGAAKLFDGAMCSSSTGGAELATIVQSLLEQPLAELRKILLHQQDELTQHRRRLLRWLNLYFDSDAVTEGHLQEHVEAVLAEEAAAAVEFERLRHDNGAIHPFFKSGCRAACAELFGPSVSLQTSLECELANCGVCGACNKGISTRTNSRGFGRGKRQCGCKRWGQRRSFTVTFAKKRLIAVEQRFRLLERQLLRLKGENSMLKAELLSCCTEAGAAATIDSLRTFFNDVIQRCSALYAEKALEADRMRQMYNAAITTLHHAPEKPAGNNRTTIPRNEMSAVTGAGSSETKPSTRFTDLTNICCNTSDTKNSSYCHKNAVSSFDISAFSTPVTQQRNAGTMKHLRDVLMRGTTFVDSSTGSSKQDLEHQYQYQEREQKQQEKQRCQRLVPKGNPLSIDCGSKVSFSCDDGVSNNVDDGMYTGLRAFREATERARNSALRALSVARMAVNTPQPPSFSPLSLYSTVCSTGGSLHSDGAPQVALVNTAAHDTTVVLEREEANLYRALGLLQREAAGLEHAAVEAMSRERQLLSRVLSA